MWGRAGRRGRGLAVYVAGEDALDQFFCRHPEEFLDRGPSRRRSSTRTAPRSTPSTCSAPPTRRRSPTTTTPILGADWRAHAEAARRRRLPARARDRVRARRGPMTTPPRASRCARRRADSFVLIDATSGEVLGTIEAARAYSTVHEGADLPAPRAAPTWCCELDLDARRAMLEPFTGDYFTQAKRESMTYIERLHERRETLGVHALVRRGRLLRDGARLPAQSGCRTTR